MKKLTIFFAIVDAIIALCFFVVYGPFEYLQNTIISTSKATKTHDYIAYTFYSEKRVNEVLALDRYIPFSEDVDLTDIVIDTSPRDTYDNEYDKAVLTRDGTNEDYKYIKVKVGKYQAHLVAIYDPSKVHLMICKEFNTGNNSGRETILKMSKRNGAVVGINGGRFVDYGYGSDIPVGYVIKDGKIAWSDDDDKANLIGFTDENKLLLINATGEEALEKGIRDAIEFGPFLIVNGELIKYTSKVGGYSRAARVAIGQRKDGIVFFLVTEGTHGNGPNMLEMAETLKLYGAYNAANLDGGTSTQLVINDKLINTPISADNVTLKYGRNVVSGFGLILD